MQRIRNTRRQVGPSLGPSYSTTNLAAVGAAVTGTYNLPVVAALYSDATALYTQAEYQTRIFGDGAAGVGIGVVHCRIGFW